MFRVIIGIVGATTHDNRCEDYDALLALAHEPIQRAPGVESGHACRRRALTRDQADVVKAVAMEARHRVEEGCELIALACVEEGGKSIDGVGRELLEIVGV